MLQLGALVALRAHSAGGCFLSTQWCGWAPASGSSGASKGPTPTAGSSVDLYNAATRANRATSATRSFFRKCVLCAAWSMAPRGPNKRKKKYFGRTDRAFAKKRATPSSFKKKEAKPAIQLRSKTEYVRTKGRKYVQSDFKHGHHPNSNRKGQRNSCMTGPGQSIDIANIIDSPRGGRAKPKQNEPQRVSSCAEMEVVAEEEIVEIEEEET